MNSFVIEAEVLTRVFFSCFVLFFWVYSKKFKPGASASNMPTWRCSHGLLQQLVQT